MGASGLGYRNIIGSFYAALEVYIATYWLQKIAMLFDSDQASETYKWLGQVPQMREWVGGRHAHGFRENGITIDNKTFEATLEVSVDDIRRDKTKQVMIRVGELAERAGGHWEELLSTLISNGTGSTNGLCYDGQYFFDDDHSEGESGTQKNLLTATEVPKLDVTTAAAPTALEAAYAILGVIAYMLTYKDDQGKPMNSQARKFLVMTSPVLWAALSPGGFSRKVGSGESNPLQAVLDNSDFEVEVVPNPLLTYTTQFVTFRTDSTAKPFIRQEEEEITMSAQAEGSPSEFDDNLHKYGVKAIRNVGYGYWQYASHATFS